MATSNKTFSEKQEKLIANELGGYQVGMSGAGAANPGDVRTYDWLVECKTHTEPDQSILFDIDVWKKIQNEAMAMHRKPVLVVDDGSQTIAKTWCLCRSANLNLSGVVTVDLPNKIRKNISCKHDKLIKHLKDSAKSVIIPGKFYQDIAYEVHWADDDVVILPFHLFKEIFEK